MLRRFLHRRERLLPRLAVVLLLAAAHCVAEDAPPKKAVRKFAPDVEKKFGELMAKMGEAKLKDEAAQLKKEIAEVAKVTGLDDAGQKALEKPGAAAVENAAKDWQGKMEETYRISWESNNLTSEVLDQWIAQASSMARNGSGTEYVRAAEQPAWKEALAQVLDQKQAAAWKAEVDEQRRKFDEQIKGVIAASRERVREQSAEGILGTVSAMTQTLTLDDERKKKLEKIAGQAADKTADSVKDKTRKMLLNYDEIRRKQILKTNSFYIAPDDNDAPEKQEIWKEGLKEILKPEEVARWEATIEKRRERRARAMAQVLLWTLDQVAAFTASQREQLLPMATELVRDQKALFAEFRTNNYYNLNLRLFYQAAAQAKDEDLKKILDEKQVAHWKSASNPTARRTRTAVARVADSSAAKAGKKPAPFEPEELEAAISGYLYNMAESEQDRALEDALLQAEDAIRVAGVEGKAVQRLQTAARGSMEQDLEIWKTGVASNIRSQMQGATPADFQQRAENVGYSSARRRGSGSDKDRKGVWEATVAAELTDAQRAAWQKEIDARKAHEQKTIVASLIAGLDQICRLTEDQWGAFDPVLTGKLTDYGPEFDQMFSNRENAWFLQSYYMLTPVAGIEEKELRKILTDEQWKQLNSTHYFSNAMSYWQNIERNQKQRVKEKKP